MHPKTIGLLLIFIFTIQTIASHDDLQFKTNQNHKTKVNLPVENKKVSTSNYKLEAYTQKTEYSLTENVLISVMLFNLDTRTFISDTVLISTPLGSKQYLLTNAVNQVTIDKSEFVTGINTIKVNYANQTVELTILRQSPKTTGDLTTMITMGDILNSQPAPGVPETVTFTLGNEFYYVFPTEANEYFQISLQYGSYNLVLGKILYPVNVPLQTDTINFTIPCFLNLQTYQLTITYSGDVFMKPTTKSFTLTIHDYSPIITTNLPSTLLDTSSVLNETSNIMHVQVEGYLPVDMEATVTVGSYVIEKTPVMNYRTELAIPISQTILPGTYELQVSFQYQGMVSPIEFTYQVDVVQKIQLIIRKDVQFVTLGQPVGFDFFCYDPRTFSGVGCNITMLDGQSKIFSMLTNNGHVQQTLTFSNVETATPKMYQFNITPMYSNDLYANLLPYKLQFYHNTSVSVQMDSTILEKKQLLTLMADTNGTFSIINENNLLINSYNYQLVGIQVNYFLNLNTTHRGLNTITVKFTPYNKNYSNVTMQKDLFVYEKIIIQQVQTNASFYQLGSYILFQGVATLGTTQDSLNGVQVSLLYDNVVIANTTIQTNSFTFIVQASNTTGLKSYKIAIYADETKFIVTSDLYEVTLSVINNFGLNFDVQDYKVGDTVHITMYGQQNREYLLYYTLNGTKVDLKDFVYLQITEFDLLVTNYGHYLLFFNELTSGDQSYYALEVDQNPFVQIDTGLLKTFTHNTIKLHINGYFGLVKVKIDNLLLENSSFSVMHNKTITLDVYTVDPGNHSLTVVFDNQYIYESVRTYYFIIYQKVELLNATITSAMEPIEEENTVHIHLRFKEFTNQSINDIPIEILTNDNTILAQANIFNSESDLQFTIIGSNLSLQINEVQERFIHPETIPLNITVMKLLSSDIKESYSFDSVTNLQIGFSYKYFSVENQFTIKYQLVKDGGEALTNTTIGQKLELVIPENGQYNLTVTVSCKECITRTYQASITLKKLFDVSNTDLVTFLGIIGAIPLGVAGITVIKKKKFVQ